MRRTRHLPLLFATALLLVISCDSGRHADMQCRRAALQAANRADSVLTEGLRVYESRGITVPPDLQSGGMEYKDLQSWKKGVADAYTHCGWIANQPD